MVHSISISASQHFSTSQHLSISACLSNSEFQNRGQNYFGEEDNNGNGKDCRGGCWQAGLFQEWWQP
eukprot:8471987-Karenia_brevis.AAC.1